ncbi:hypothetical protein DM52_2717 [Burkholderia mallei]|nr:hypothetical protein DM52_2717 [Burkholderia mallei]
MRRPGRRGRRAVAVHTARRARGAAGKTAHATWAACAGAAYGSPIAALARSFSRVLLRARAAAADGAARRFIARRGFVAVHLLKPR